MYKNWAYLGAPKNQVYWTERPPSHWFFRLWHLTLLPWGPANLRPSLSMWPSLMRMTTHHFSFKRTTQQLSWTTFHSIRTPHQSSRYLNLDFLLNLLVRKLPRIFLNYHIFLLSKLIFRKKALSLKHVSILSHFSAEKWNLRAKLCAYLFDEVSPCYK